MNVTLTVTLQLLERDRLSIRGTQRRFPSKYVENTFQAIQSTFRSLEMHSKRRYKTFICSVILGEVKSFRNYKGFSNYFSERFRCNLTFYESENFSDSSLQYILESENFRSPFSKKNSVRWVVKYGKLNFRKSQGIYQISFENCT